MWPRNGTVFRFWNHPNPKTGNDDVLEQRRLDRRFGHPGRRRLPSFVFDYSTAAPGADWGVAHGSAALQRLRCGRAARRHRPGRHRNHPVRPEIRHAAGGGTDGHGQSVWPETDLALARLAQRNASPIAGTVASTGIEDIARAAPDSTCSSFTRRAPTNRAGACCGAAPAPGSRCWC